jgi:hypothetical protein
VEAGGGGGGQNTSASSIDSAGGGGAQNAKLSPAELGGIVIAALMKFFESGTTPHVNAIAAKTKMRFVIRKPIGQVCSH